MRTTEQLGIAFRNLLTLAEKSPVQLSYRGIDDHDRKLYEIKSRDGNTLCQQATENELIKLLDMGQSNG